ncbi:glycoside hydrolase family 3 protein [Schizophyllum commune Loenen D]|nr:glycoside hydrolase family 3 protein [Schizophyllum commune Loenen D]
MRTHLFLHVLALGGAVIAVPASNSATSDAPLSTSDASSAPAGTLSASSTAISASATSLSVSSAAQTSSGISSPSSSPLPATGSASSSLPVSASASASAPSSTATSKIPTPILNDEWAAAYEKAEAAVAKLSLEEKVNITTGTGFKNGPCVGNTPPIPSIGYPLLCLQDGPLGVRAADNVSAFNPGVNAAATFNRKLIRARGAAVGEEFRGKGIHVALGPDMNMMRTAAAGRNWEGFGADPYLAGEAAYETIKGIQGAGVQTSAKHFINNEQEHYRQNSSSIVDDRTQHEIYLAPFLKSALAGTASFMCSYINGSWACANDAMINEIMKGEWGYPGYVMSDWGATHEVADVNGGLDMTMPGDDLTTGEPIFGPKLIEAVNNGTVSEERVTDAAKRILAAWYLLGQDEGFPETNFNTWDLEDPATNQHVNVQADHGSLIREIADASTVLLRNEDNILPLASSKNAKNGRRNNAKTAPSSIAILGNGAGPSSKGLNGCEYQSCDDGVLGMGWGSGSGTYPYLITPVDAITARAAEDGTEVTSSLDDYDTQYAADLAAEADVALVFITSDSGEDLVVVEGTYGDRNDLYAWHEGDALVQAVADANENTIVCVNTVGPIIVEKWIDHPNVKAVVWTGLPSQEAGNSIADILYGEYNPSGRLPYTIAKSPEDYPASVLYLSPTGPFPDIPYSERLFIDYRHFDANNIEPRYEFGFGLSYTTFEYADIAVSGAAPTDGAALASMDPSLHETVATVSFSVQNTGDVAGHEIAQLYATFPEETSSAPLNLKGFESVHVKPGVVEKVELKLTRYDLSVWDVERQGWVVPEGELTISVGASSRDIRLTGTVN